MPRNRQSNDDQFSYSEKLFVLRMLLEGSAFVNWLLDRLCELTRSVPFSAAQLRPSMEWREMAKQMPDAQTGVEDQ
jgi:hypothetical protein